jgi:hypothetical protein
MARLFVKEVLRLQHASPQWQAQYFRLALDFEFGGVKKPDIVILYANEEAVNGYCCRSSRGLWGAADGKKTI